MCGLHIVHYIHTMPTVEYTDLSVSDFLGDFRGRFNMLGYDETKQYKIAECNRDYVWTPELKTGFIQSVIKNEPIPSLILCNNELIDGGNRATTMCLYYNDGFKADDKLYSELSFEDQAAFRQCSMPVTIIEDATDSEKADYYEKFNKGIVLTFGQKMENRSDRPLVKAAFSLIGHPGYPESPLHNLIARVWSPDIPNGKVRSEVTLAYKIIMSSMFGSAHYNLDWGAASERIRDTGIVNLTNLRRILEVLNIDPNGMIPEKKKKAYFQKFIGAVLHDSWLLEGARLTQDQFTRKWQRFFGDAYNVLTNEQVAKIATYKPMGLQHNTTRCAAISMTVSTYLRGQFQFNLPIAIHLNEENDF